MKINTIRAALKAIDPKTRVSGTPDEITIRVRSYTSLTKIRAEYHANRERNAIRRKRR